MAKILPFRRKSHLILYSLLKAIKSNRMKYGALERAFTDQPVTDIVGRALKKLGQ